MSSVAITGRPGDQTIVLSVESWLAAFSQASNRTYLNQSYYDPDDTSAQATIAASNGMRRDNGASPGLPFLNPGPGGQLGGVPYVYAPYPDLKGSEIPGAGLHFR